RAFARAADTVTCTVSFTDALFTSSTLSADNVRLVATGTADGTLSFDASTGMTRTVTISNLTGKGTLALFVDAGAASDRAGNTSGAAGPGPAWIVDDTALTISGTTQGQTTDDRTPIHPFAGATIADDAT